MDFIAYQPFQICPVCLDRPQYPKTCGQVRSCKNRKGQAYGMEKCHVNGRRHVHAVSHKGCYLASGPIQGQQIESHFRDLLRTCEGNMSADTAGLG